MSEEEILFQTPQSQELVQGYLEATAYARAGGQVMATEIEGHGRLARLQQIVDWRQEGSQMERQFLATFFELKEYFGAADEVYLKDKFIALKNAEYKNAGAFLLAEIVLRDGAGAITRAGLDKAKSYSGQIDQPDMAEEDLIRYCRLIS